tara:strand:+ start:44 stop:1138 length:1095 start_codon:yes stop_codon:yes gene_type:complete
MTIKRFKDMFEDAPVNSTGVAVSTDKPIVRKKKKKEDSGYREIGTPELLKRYMDDTPGQSMNESRKKDMTAISSWKKKLKNVKGLSKDVMQQLSQLPTPVVTSLINQIGMIVAGDEDEHPPHVKDKEKEKKKVVLKGSLQSVNEARLMTDGKIVTNVSQVLDIIAKGLKKEMGRRYKANQKDGLAYINNLAKMVGMKATDKKQVKNRMFLKMGDFDELDEGLWDNIRKKKARIKAGSGEKMRKKGEKGAPTADQIRRAQEETCCDDCDNLFDHVITEAEYQGKKVKLNDPIRGGSKKFYVYVKNEKGNVVKVSFGDTTGLSIKRDDPKRRASFRARHNCDNPGPKWKARYWSCYQWRAGAKVNN